MHINSVWYWHLWHCFTCNLNISSVSEGQGTNLQPLVYNNNFCALQPWLHWMTGSLSKTVPTESLVSQAWHYFALYTWTKQLDNTCFFFQITIATSLAGMPHLFTVRHIHVYFRWCCSSTDHSMFIEIKDSLPCCESFWSINQKQEINWKYMYQVIAE